MRVPKHILQSLFSQAIPQSKKVKPDILRERNPSHHEKNRGQQDDHPLCEFLQHGTLDGIIKHFVIIVEDEENECEQEQRENLPCRPGK